MTDPSLRVPVLPSLARALGSLRFGLERRTGSDDDPGFTLGGTRALATGGQTRGVDEVRTCDPAPSRLLTGLEVHGADLVDSVLTPLGLERRLRVGGVQVVERIVVPRSDPVCFFEWSAETDIPLTLSWLIPPPPAGGLRWRASERALVTSAGEDRAMYVLSSAPLALDVSPVSGAGPDGGLSVTARLDVDGARAVRLAVVGVAEGDDEARILRVVGRGHVVVPGRRGTAQRIVDDRLAVDAPDGVLGEALSWAKVELDGGVACTASDRGLSDRDVRLVLAALASGDAAPARSVLTTLAAEPHGGADEDADAAARPLIVAARYLAWTGDLRGVRPVWETLRNRIESCLQAAAAGTATGRVAAALRAMEPAAEEAGDDDLAGRIRAALGTRPTSGAGLEPGGESDGLLRSAALIEAVVRGLLGTEPDATRGRLVLRPRLPASWARFSMRNLAVGEARVGLEYVRREYAGTGAHRFSLRQEAGVAPLRVILEPELPGARLVGARVDGAPADLDGVVMDGRVRVPVQLVLDHERRVEVEIAEQVG